MNLFLRFSQIIVLLDVVILVVGRSVELFVIALTIVLEGDFFNIATLRAICRTHIVIMLIAVVAL